ncbi:probable receptor-like protein kinase At5g24010 [Magnolia sinica]|uniref:probable receptor-like protein kinase At5g24010 n=1 Tax=Magnolia sinica TaxID=86752 RepID=UPI0026586094|nr:probable receptor-like protein kinase At5g24010 [Magnolia sinica]
MENLFFFLSLLSSLFFLSSSFTPPDNHLITCGSTLPATTPNNRVFLPDSKSDLFLLSSHRKISIQDPNPPPNSNPLYESARIFTKPSSYSFPIKSTGPHIVRLHFAPFSSDNYNLSSSFFHVSALQFSLLRNFSVPENTHVVKEYIINTGSEKKLVISFDPACKSSFAFVNAIEVISASDDLIADVARLVDPEGIKDYDGLLGSALETIHRINVGGPKVTPFNDTLWRNWIPDEKFLLLKDSSKAISFSGRIKYQPGGATRLIAPDSIYNTARVLNVENAKIAEPNFNITWEFPVNLGYKYLVRMHFCDIVSPVLNQLYFDVYLNGFSAYEDIDLSHITNMLASPHYVDFVVEPEISGVIRVTVGPSSLNPSDINAILNGLEIMKLNNSIGSLDGEFEVVSVKSWMSKNVGVFLCSVLGGIAFMCILIAAFMLVSRRWTTLRDSVAWSPLPPDVSEGSTRYRNMLSTGKLGYVKV